MKIDLFQPYGYYWVFQICWHIECRTLTALSFRIWNSSTGIPSLVLALFVVIHTVKAFGIVNKAKIGVFLELSCLFNDLTDVGNLISGSSAFSKSSLNIWKVIVHILLKPGLENFEHYFISMWDEYSCAVVWAFFGIGMKTDLFQSYGHCWVFQIR